ncbi:MAG TPA: hypothetical protein DEH78_13360, partial [Solibacterales bacterium]|nr:hypothetical protein [Bryobacterales bacterium]
VVERAYSVRDVFAVLKEPPSQGTVTVVLRQDSDVVGTLTITAGETMSNVIDGFGLEPLRSLGELQIDITSVGDVGGGNPGRDLTVVIRL